MAQDDLIGRCRNALGHGFNPADLDDGTLAFFHTDQSLVEPLIAQAVDNAVTSDGHAEK